MESRQVNPIQNLFNDIEKIINFIELKDDVEAGKYEKPEYVHDATLWMNASLERDTYLTYQHYWNMAMFQEVVPNTKLNNIQRWLKDPYKVPLIFRENLLRRGRELFLKQYEEKNNYYRMLNGLPPIEHTKEDFIFVSEQTALDLNISIDIPVHELSPLIQNRLILLPEFQNILKENPDKKYLNYFGLYKIDLLTARRAKDFDIIRYVPMDRSDINPNLLKEFGALYGDYRVYVMETLYNTQLEPLYVNYRSFMRILILFMTLMQITNKAVEYNVSRQFLDDTVLHIILSMYGIPRNLLMTKQVRRNLVINLLKLTREKATDEVFYNLIRILGYHDINISKLMLLKGQTFDILDQEFDFELYNLSGPNRVSHDVGSIQLNVDLNYEITDAVIKSIETEDTLFWDNTKIRTFEDMDKLIILDDNNQPLNSLNAHPYFLAIDLKDKNPYHTIISGNAKRFGYREITDRDPQWWDFTLPERDFIKHDEICDVQRFLIQKYYNIADSKYLMIEAVIHQMRFLFESIYFTRMILDNKSATDNFKMTIPELFGTELLSIYDLLVFLVAATCMNNGLTGEISNSELGLLAVAGFNFDIDINLFKEYLSTTRYVDKERLLLFLENLSMRTPSDIYRIFNDVLYPLRQWLENKISQTTNKLEFLEYESIYRALFTYDIAHNSFLDDFILPIQVIQNELNISNNDMLAFKHFYPRTYQGLALTELEQDEIFISYQFPITWNIEIPYKGTLFFHDILNSPDLRYLYDQNGTLYDQDDQPVKNPLFWDDYGNGEWGIDRDAVRDAINLINGLREDELRLAHFWKDTPVLGSNGRQFRAGERLPSQIRSGVFRDILTRKINMDIQGKANPPTTFIEYLYRKNSRLYNLLTENNRFETDRDGWINDVMTIIVAIETELNMHMKYFEKSIVGTELFFRPLITLINHFKSTFVMLIKTSMKHVFGDKIDSGGNSNMFKIFDQIRVIIHFIVLSRRGQAAEFGLYDTEPNLKYKLNIQDRSEMIQSIIAEATTTSPGLTKLKPVSFKALIDRLPHTGGWTELQLLIEKDVIIPATKKTFDAETLVVNPRRSHFGSIRLVDEALFKKNGKWIDREEISELESKDFRSLTPLLPHTGGIGVLALTLEKNLIVASQASAWFAGEHDVGRFDQIHDHTSRTRTGTARIRNARVDVFGWKEFVEK